MLSGVGESYGKSIYSILMPGNKVPNCRIYCHHQAISEASQPLHQIACIIEKVHFIFQYINCSLLFSRVVPIQNWNKTIDCLGESCSKLSHCLNLKEEMRMPTLLQCCKKSGIGFLEAVTTNIHFVSWWLDEPSILQFTT